MNHILCLLFILYIHSFVSSLFVPKLLLPYYDKVQVNYTIIADEGCFKWYSQNPEVASIEPIPKDTTSCTSSAIVFVQSRSSSRRITLIFAENVVTGAVLQCDVIVDQIVDIDIVSRTRELYLDDPPEELSIRALDEEGNTFSSTAYVLFSWKLLPDEVDSSNPPHKILHIMKFIETDYKAEPYVEQLERRGLQSDTILLAGLQTGSAFVFAKMHNGKEIMTAKIGIVVRDKVFLIPNGAVWIPVHGIIQYRVEKWRSGKPTQVTMPHQQYYLELSEQLETDELPAVSLDSSTSVVVGLRLGSIQLYLMDRNLKKDTIQDFSVINVVEPAYIRFSIQPDERWVLETKRHYTIIVLMFDSNDQRLYPSSNVRITVNIDPVYFDVLESTSNGTWHRVQTLQKGVSELYAVLSGIMLQSGSVETYHPVIDATQTAEIYDPIVVYPPIVAFPWMPKPVLYKHKLEATGGSGNYTWSIDNDSFAFVTTVGVVTTKTGPEQENKHELASAEVRATDMRNPAHWGSSIVVLAPVEEIVFARSRREAEIGDYLDLYITMHARFKDELVPIGDCRECGIEWKVQDTSLFEDVPGHQVEIPKINGSIACAGRRLKALREGFTVLVARFEQTLPNNKKELLEASVTIVAFPPLKAIDPVSLAVVSLDATKILRFRGGPTRWPLWHSGHDKEPTATNDSVVKLFIPHHTHQEHIVIAWCRRLGHSVVTLKVFNKPCNTNPMPAEASVAVRVSCTIPHHLELKVTSLLLSCPLHSTSVVQTVAVMNNAFSINLTLYNDFGHVFDNFSSVHAEWSSNMPDMQFETERSLFLPLDSTEQRKHVVQKLVNLAVTEGEHIITVSMTRYRDETSSEICSEYDCNQLDPVVTGTVGVLVVSPPVISPSRIVLYNHENFSKEVTVIGGSGHFSYHLEQRLNVSTILNSENAELRLGPVGAGIAQLQITDLCLTGIPMATADVIVVEIGRLVLKAAPRLEIGETVDVVVEIVDNFGDTVPAEFLSYFDLEIIASVKDVLFVAAIKPTVENELILESKITGTIVGTTMLSVVAKSRDGHLVKSNAIHIVVVSSLELHPPVVTLTRNAEFQLRTIGGPRSDFTMKFLVEEDADVGVVAVSQSGVVRALQVGVTRVTAQAVMHDGQVFYCKSPTEIRVIQLTGIRIDAPLTQYHVGGTIPLHVNGYADDQNPMSFGGTVPGLIFKWESGNPSVVKLHTVHSKAGIETSSQLSFTMLAEGMSSGHCVVTVRVTAEDKSSDLLALPEFSAEISLMVYEPLAIISTESCVRKQWKSTSNFLITPSTSHSLQTNRDGVAKMVAYDVLSPRRCTPELFYSTDGTDDCVVVSERGVIESGPNQCQTTLLITSVERFGINQTMALTVLVRPVSYVIARAVTEFRTRDNAPSSNAFPLSATVRFAVDQFDDSSDKFDATSHDVILDLNRYDKVEVEPESGNRTFNLRLPLEGTTIMSVASYLTSTTTPSSVYYFPINVLPALQPQQQKLTVGLKFCFFSEFINLNGSTGSWFTVPQNPKFLVEAKTGAVVAVGRGEAEVSYEVDSLEANAEVTTVPFVANLHDGSLTGPVLSNVDLYALPITLSPSYDDFDPSKCIGLENEMSKLAGKLFTCSLCCNSSNIEEFYSAQPEYVTKTGSFACVIRHRDLNETDLKILATVQDRVVVKLGVQSLHLGSVRDAVTSLLFLPQFVVHMSTTTLVVGSYAQLCIIATPQVHESIKIVPCDPGLLDIGPDYLSGENDEFCYRVVTYNKDVHIRSTFFRVVSHLTEQDEKIDLMIDRVPGRLISTPSQCSNVDRTLWRGASDIITDSYLAYLTTFAVIIISTALLIAAFTAYRWVSNNSARPAYSHSPPPYDPGAGGTSLRSPGSPGSSPKVRLWSRYYQPQQASPSSG